MTSDVLHPHADECAVCGSRLIKIECTLSQNGIGNGSNVHVLRRAPWWCSCVLDIPGPWECKVCGATRCWPARKRCYKCDAPRDTVPNNLPTGPWDGRSLSHAVLVLLLVALALDVFHPGILVLEVCPPPGAGVGPSPGGNETEKRTEASKLLQALSLLQRIMTPEAFVTYQVLVTPKSKPEKTREQELADRVKSLQRLRTQEATHRAQIVKLELDLQRHRDMLQGSAFTYTG